MSKHRTYRIEGPFAPRLVEMHESPAMRVLSLTGHRILMRIEVEHANHGGYENGRLVVTHDQFQEFGIHHHAVGPGLREVVALGLVEITEHGCAGAEHRAPNRFRLTYRNTAHANPTHEWRRIKTVAEAEQIARDARKAQRIQRRVRQPRKTFFTAGKRQVSLPVSGSENTNSPVPESGTTGPVPDSGTTVYISGRGRGNGRFSAKHSAGDRLGPATNVANGEKLPWAVPVLTEDPTTTPKQWDNGTEVLHYEHPRPERGEAGTCRLAWVEIRSQVNGAAVLEPSGSYVFEPPTAKLVGVLVHMRANGVQHA